MSAANADVHGAFDQVALLGDPYPTLEPTRGVSMAAPMELLPGPPCFGGDWRLEDLKQGGFEDWPGPRGCSPTHAGEAIGPLEHFPSEPPGDEPLQFLGGFIGGGQDPSAVVELSGAPLWPFGSKDDSSDFHAHHAPRKFPSDPLFSLEPTTLWAFTCSPYTVGNHVLDFLRHEVVSTNLRVKHGKFSIKCDLLHQHAPCSLKIKVFEIRRDEHAFEVQRRSGDPLAFRGVFGALAAFLRGRCRCVRGPPAAPAGPEPDGVQPMVPARPCGDEGAEEFGALFDLAARAADFPEAFQAELAAACAQRAYDEDTARPEFTGQALEALGELVQARPVEVSYPAAAALHQLALHKGSAQLLAAKGTPELLLNQLQKDPLPDVLRQRLAQAFGAVVVQCAWLLSYHALEQLLGALGELLHRASVLGFLASPEIHEAHAVLLRRFQTFGYAPALYS